VDLAPETPSIGLSENIQTTLLPLNFYARIKKYNLFFLGKFLAVTSLLFFFLSFFLSLNESSFV
jgi:hypothetical protein